ncbi:MAG TPA: MFS transporter [Candidatus Nitrosopolaris sp.]|nr:MFS transporter [Candidatus Nitrosopolaris sp.]
MSVDSAPQQLRSRWRALVGEGLLLTTVGLCLIETTAGLQTLLVATVLPRAVRDIGGIQLYGLVFSGYVLAGIVSIPASGADADRHGPARPLLRYSAYFLVGTVMAALAPSMPVLVVARFIQGYGGGAMYTLAYAIVPRVYPAHLRPKMLSLLSGVWVVTGLLGPPLGALLANTVGWRWAIAVAIPTLLLGYSVLAARTRHIPPDNASRRQGLGAAVMLMVGSAVFLAGLSTGGWGWVAALGGLALALPSVYRLVPPAMRRGLFGKALVVSFGLNMSFFTIDSFIPLMLTSVRGTSLAIAGAAVTAAAISWFPGSLWQQLVAQTMSVRRQALISCSALLAAAVTVAAAIVGVPLWVVFLGAITEGLAMGVASNMVLLMAMEPSDDHGTGMLMSTRFLVGRLGLVLGTGLAGVSVAAGSRGGAASTAGIAGAMGIGIAGAVVALVAAWQIRRE